ncbi:type VI secretion system protein TssA [Alkalimarinus alittae]|uniref:Type VI secretion system protein TssA n=1 Tax=Alkalimarinus alittae TaxID=2961619 RepID=A0ABY6MZB1_9ALTE|nr:type VI secretion system protein TssA [Alkalimarinus alittae]UZE95107.1 type VI secretion system protein TssA [Alkalimarinus alittae]
MISLSNWRNAVLSPIDKTCAVGVSVRLDERFDALQLEVSHDLALEGASTDWRKVLTLSHEILSSESKDLLVLVYSVRAVIDAYRYEGFAEALSTVNRYVELYWIDSFPALKRKRARMSALEWLAQQLEVWVESHPPDPEEKGSVESVLVNIKALNQSLSELGGDWHLDLFSATRNINEYLPNLPVQPIKSVVEDKPKTSTDQPQAEIVPINTNSKDVSHTVIASSKPNVAAIAVQESANPQPSITDDRSYNQCIRETQSLLKRLGKYRLSKDLADSSAYEINRFSVWLPVSELPLHQNGLTPLRSIPADKRHFFETLLQQRQYEILIIELENSLSNAPFWLDGHRMVVESLKALDMARVNNTLAGAYQNAIDVIATLTKSFVDRLSGIEHLTFSDGSPFADDETQAWLVSIDTLRSGTAESPNHDFRLKCTSETYPSSQMDDSCVQNASNAINASNQAYKDSGFSQGLLLLDQYCNEQMNKKAWYKARLLTVDYCFKAKEFIFAEQLLIELDELALSHNLDVWEPEMVGSMLSMMLICKAKLKRKQSSDCYYQRLVRVNPQQGYEMKSFAS